ncbi:MAG: hypothetical protein IKJ97_02945 [Bacteroidaceae bacterium]|nr:hypothetical protein [Bacteroidaceae bacterium]
MTIEDVIECTQATTHLYLPHKSAQCNAIFSFPTWLLHFSKANIGHFCIFPKQNMPQNRIFPKSALNSPLITGSLALPLQHTNRELVILSKAKNLNQLSTLTPLRGLEPWLHSL